MLGFRKWNIEQAKAQNVCCACFSDTCISPKEHPSDEVWSDEDKSHKEDCDSTHSLETSRALLKSATL